MLKYLPDSLHNFRLMLYDSLYMNKLLFLALFLGSFYALIL